jgi:predicted dehydrogenase
MIRLAFVGCGKVVETFHLPALAEVAGLALTAVVDANPEKARALVERAGLKGIAVSRRLDDVMELCDAALVALPNHLHADTCIALLERGRHVLVEKPMATAPSECDRMIAAAERSTAHLGAAMVRRFIPAYPLVRDLIANGTFGRLRRIDVSEGVAYDWPAATGFFLKRAEAGGGVLVDFGSHVLDALIWWLGPLSVTEYRDDAAGGVEAECAVRLATATGVGVTIALSRLRDLPCSARVEWEGATLEIGLRSGAAHLAIGSAPYPLQGFIGADADGKWSPETNPFVLQLRAFVDAIGSRVGVAPTARIARDAARTFEACAALRQPLNGPAAPFVEALSAAAGPAR